MMSETIMKTRCFNCKNKNLNSKSKFLGFFSYKSIYRNFFKFLELWNVIYYFEFFFSNFEIFLLFFIKKYFFSVLKILVAIDNSDFNIKVKNQLSKFSEFCFFPN